MVGLCNCDNTSELNKPVSTATRTAIADLSHVVNQTTQSLSLAISLVNDNIRDPAFGNEALGFRFAFFQSQLQAANEASSSNAAAITELAAKQDPDFEGTVNIDGLLYTGNLLLYDLQSLPVPYQRGRMIHPHMLEFCISDISRSQTSEIYLTLANDNIYLNQDTRVVEQLEVDSHRDNKSNGWLRELQQHIRRKQTNFNSNPGCIKHN
jgi:hypothetical protein